LIRWEDLCFSPDRPAAESGEREEKEEGRRDGRRWRKKEKDISFTRPKLDLIKLPRGRKRSKPEKESATKSL
jgi:hypothetical protein